MMPRSRTNHATEPVARGWLRARLAERWPALILFALMIAAGILGGKVLADQVGMARASSTSKLVRLAVREDSFYNYDFNSPTVSATNVDWPVGLLFWNSASVSRVKDLYRPAYPYAGSTQDALVNDGAGDLWASDPGLKDRSCPAYRQFSRHMRLYADGDGQLYNIDWGYYVLGTAHRDYQECWFTGTQYGWSEEAEGVFANYARSRGYAVSDDAIDFSNFEPPRWEGNHYFDNDGRASAINLGSASGPTHDVAVTSVNAPASLTQGQTAPVQVTVQNLGTISEQFMVSLSSSPANPAGSPPDQQVSLGANQSTTLTFQWPTSSATTPGSYILTATASLSGDQNPGNNSGSDSIQVQPPSSARELWVQNLTASASRYWFWYRIAGVVTIQGDNGPVGNAVVTLRLTGPGTSVAFTVTTNSSGQASYSRTVSSRGTYQVTVEQVAAGGYSYNPARNVVSSASATTP